MITEVTPTPKERLASLALTLASVVKELAILQSELKEPAPQFLAQEWLPLAHVAALYGFKTPKACKEWAKRKDLPYKLLGKRIFFKQSDLDTLLEKAPPREGQPPKVKKTAIAHPRQEAAEAALLQLVRR